MNTKNLSVVLVVLVLIGVVSFFAASNGVSSAVQVPNEINLWIEGLTLALVTSGLAWVFSFAGLDLRGLATPISAALSGWLILELQGLVNLIPDTYDAYVSIGFKILVVVLSGVGALYLLALQRRGAGVGSVTLLK